MSSDQSTFDLARLIGLLDRGRTGEAIEIATELVREMPGHVTGHVVRARAFESQGDFREALLSWRTALDLVPNSPLILKGLRRTAEKLALSEDFPGSGQPVPHGYDDLSGEANLPGFQSVGSMFDVEPEFERLLAEDLTADVPDAGLEPREDLESSGESGSIAGVPPRFPDDPREARPDTRSEARSEARSKGLPDSRSRAGQDTDSHQDLSVDAAYAAVIELASAPDEHSTTDDLISDDSVGADSAVADSAVADSAVTDTTAADLTADVVPAPEKNGVATDDLDGLIAELSTARITPADRSFPSPNLDTPIDNVATETLARIFAEQKQYQDAARVYTKLADLRPEEKDEFLRRASEMRSLAGLG